MKKRTETTHFRLCNRCHQTFTSPYRNPVCCPKCYRPNRRNVVKNEYILTKENINILKDNIENKLGYKRQAIKITTKQLRLLADKLDKEIMNDKVIDCGKNQICNIVWNIPIINKQPKCSDTWEFER